MLSDPASPSVVVPDVDTAGPDLAAIRARAEAATTGPWLQGDKWPDGGLFAWEVVVSPQLPCIALEDTQQGRKDAEFIAHARQDIPALIAEVEMLRSLTLMPTCASCGGCGVESTMDGHTIGDCVDCGGQGDEVSRLNRELAEVTRERDQARVSQDVMVAALAYVHADPDRDDVEQYWHELQAAVEHYEAFARREADRG